MCKYFPRHKQTHLPSIYFYIMTKVSIICFIFGPAKKFHRPTAKFLESDFSRSPLQYLSNERGEALVEHRPGSDHHEILVLAGHLRLLEVLREPSGRQEGRAQELQYSTNSRWKSIGFTPFLSPFQNLPRQ